MDWLIFLLVAFVLQMCALWLPPSVDVIVHRGVLWLTPSVDISVHTPGAVFSLAFSVVVGIIAFFVSRRIARKTARNVKAILTAMQH